MRVFTIDSAVLGLGSPGCECCAVRIFDRNLQSRVPLVPTPARLKLLHACDQWHSSRVFNPLIGWHCKLCRNTEGHAAYDDAPVSLVKEGPVFARGVLHIFAAGLRVVPSNHALPFTKSCKYSSMVQCAFCGRNLRSRMLLDPTHSSRTFTFLTSSHCKLRPNTEG